MDSICWQALRYISDMDNHIKSAVYKAIPELLRHHECVVIPALGAFITSKRSSLISSDGKIHPPHTSVSFNTLLHNNDGILIHYLARQLSIDYTHATELVRQTVDDIKLRLKKNEVIFFPHVGSLRLNREKKMIFTPSDDMNFLLSSYGLVPVVLPQKHSRINNIQQLPELTTNTLVEEKPKISTSHSELSQPDKRQKKYFLYALAASLSGIILITQFLLFNIKSQEISLANINPSDTWTLLRRNPAALPISSTDSYHVPIVARTVSSEDMRPRPNFSPIIIHNESLPSGYYIITGSFRRFENAEKAFRSLQSRRWESYIIPTDHEYYRVGVFISDSPLAVSSQLSYFKNNYQRNAWVLQNI